MKLFVIFIVIPILFIFCSNISNSAYTNNCDCGFADSIGYTRWKYSYIKIDTVVSYYVDTLYKYLDTINGITKDTIMPRIHKLISLIDSSKTSVYLFSSDSFKYYPSCTRDQYQIDCILNINAKGDTTISICEGVFRSYDCSWLQGTWECNNCEITFCALNNINKSYYFSENRDTLYLNENGTILGYAKQLP